MELLHLTGNQVRALLTANALSSRSASLSALLDGRRDIDTECGYISEPGPNDFNLMYQKEGVAKRVVHIWPDECWQEDPIVYETLKPELTTFEKAWKELVEEYDLFAVMAQADRISGIGRYGIILFGVDNDRGNLNQPVAKAKARKLLYARTFDESVLTIEKYENDLKSARYGKPEQYNVNFAENTAGGSTSLNSSVHWSRCVHLADNRRMSDVLGESRMRHVFNRLQDIRKILGGSAEMFWQGAFPGLSFEVDPNLLAAGATIEVDTTAIKAELQNYVNGLQRYLSTTGVSVKSLAPQVADPSHHLEEQMKAIAVSIGVPFRVFMGTEEAKLASNQDTRSWSKRLKHRQNKYLTPFVVRPTIDRLIAMGVLPQPEKKLTIKWPDMLTPSDQEKAEVAKVRTEAMKNYIEGNVEALMDKKNYLTRELGYSEEEADILLETAAELDVMDDQKTTAILAKKGLAKPKEKK